LGFNWGLGGVPGYTFLRMIPLFYSKLTKSMIEKGGYLRKNLNLFRKQTKYIYL
jgi:hypothetical protein